MLKVAIDSGPLTSGDSVRGIGVYVRELIKSLEKLDLDISTVHRSQFTEHFDVIHFTSFNPFFISIPFNKPKNTKFVITIYDLIPLIYPKYYKPGLRGSIRFLLNKYLIKKNIDAIITISETSKKDICRFLRVSPDKVFVTYLAPRSVTSKLDNGNWKNEIKAKYKLPNNFALYAGDVNYNKNIPNLIMACKLANIPLVLAGKQALSLSDLISEAKTLSGPMDYLRRLFNIPHPELSHYNAILKSLKDNKQVLRLGYVDDEDLNKIFNLASVYIQASYYEGFGLPLVEASKIGIPIAVSRNQCHAEILGDEFDYFNPSDINSIVKAVLQPNINKKVNRNYSWDKTAEETLKIYEMA